MIRFVPSILCAILTGSTGAMAADAACPPGELMHWIADYCMAEVGTDDEIVVSDCINRESTATFADRCVAALHYKREMCKTAISRTLRSGTETECMDDPTFVGHTVKNGGPGG
jgi:hypothetical protein